MDKFIESIDEKVVSKEVKVTMLKDSFNKVLVQAFEGTGVGNYTVNEFGTFLNTVTPEEVVQTLKEDGFTLTVENRELRIRHKYEQSEGMNRKDVAFLLFAKLED